MILPQFPDSRSLTHSSTSTFQKCNRCFFLSYRLGLRAAFSSDPLRWGGAYHAGLERLKAGGTEDDAVADVRALYARRGTPPWMDPHAYACEREAVCGMLRAYARRWGDDAIVEYLAVEQIFRLPIRNPMTGEVDADYDNSGMIDGVVRLPDGRVGVMEHKTTSEDISKLDSAYFSQLRMNGQVSRYFLAGEQIGHAIEVIAYDVTRKPQIRPKKVAKADRAAATARGDYYGLPLTETCPEQETPEMYGARVLADATEEPDRFFRRIEIPRLDDDLAEYEAEQYTILEQIRSADARTPEWGAAAWPRNPGACMDPFRCEFVDVCKGLVPEDVLAGEVPHGFKRRRRLHEELPEPGTEQPPAGA